MKLLNLEEKWCCNNSKKWKICRKAEH